MANYKRIIISSKIVDLHGVGLRDLIRQKLEGKIKGKIRNIAEGVEIIYEEDSEYGYKSIEVDILHAIATNSLIDDEFKEKIKIEQKDKLFEDGFQLDRSNELQEMVWALQGAGKMFKSRDSTGLRPVVTQVMPSTVESLAVKNKPPVSDWWFLTRVSEQITERDDKKDKRLIMAVCSELTIIHDEAASYTTASDVLLLDTPALGKFIVEYPIEDAELFKGLRELYTFCVRARYIRHNCGSQNLPYYLKIIQQSCKECNNKLSLLLSEKDKKDGGED